MAAPVVAGLEELVPDGAVDMLIKAPFAGLGDMLEGVSETIWLPSDRGKRVETRHYIERRGYSTVIILPNSFRSAWEMWQAGIPERIGYDGEFRRWLLTKAIPRPPKHSLSQKEYYSNIAQSVYPEITIKPVSVRIPEDAAKKSETLLLVDAGKPVVGVGFGASYGDAKMWPAERFAALIDRLSEIADVVLFGAASDAEAERKVLSMTRSEPLSLVGKTDLPTLAACFNRLGLYITNDTGPMHLAAAAGAPVVAIFGPTSPDETRPEGGDVTVIYHDADCAPCWRRQCPTDHKCMESIKVNEVFDAACAALRRGGRIR